MRTYIYIVVIALFILSSCSSGLYVSGEYDDLYFVPSDRAVYTDVQVNPGVYASGDELESIYGVDTLVAEDYIDAVGYDDDIAYYGDYDRSVFDYNYGSGYSSYLNRFYGNYFDPYWRDPYYGGWGFNNFGYSYGFGYPSMSFYYGMGSPWYYSPSRFYSPYSYYSWNSYFYDPYYSSFYGYSPYYGYYPGVGSYPSSQFGSAGNASRRSYSTLTRGDAINTSAKSRSDSYTSSGTRATADRSSLTGVSERRSDTRSATTSATGAINDRSRSAVTQDPDVRRSEAQRSAVNTRTRESVQTGTRTIDKPVYNQTQRSYNPTYTNPRMTTRPAYNNSNSSRSTINNSNRSTINNSSRSTINNNSRNSAVIRTNPVNRSSSINRSSSVNRGSSVNRSTSTGSRIPAMRSTSTTPVRSSSSVSSGSRSVTGRSSISTGSSRSVSSGSVSSGSRSTSGTSRSTSSSTGRSGKR